MADTKATSRRGKAAVRPKASHKEARAIKLFGSANARIIFNGTVTAA